jgi:membrane-associated protease RseP (regulator of RpoE activity)
MVSKEHVMSLNVGTFDRAARIVIGLALIAFALGYLAPGTGWNWVGWIGVVPILTALFGICPAYSLFGMSTR